MKNPLRRLIALTLATQLLLSSCNTLAVPTPAPLIPGLAQTLAAQTLTAQQVGWQASSEKTSTPPPPTALPIDPDLPTSTPESAETMLPMLTPFQDSPLAGSAIQEPEACINAAEFIKDISIPDNSMMSGGEKFIKTWQFKNIGTCTWTPDYSVIFIWGDRMGGESPKPLGQTVAPGQMVEISILLQAPKEPGGYQGSWIFVDPNGNQFGTGYQARNLFWVSIAVADKFDRFFGGRGGCVGGG